MNEDLSKVTEALAVRAQGLRVVDRETANRAGEIVLLGKDVIKKIKDFFAPLKRAQDEAKQKLISAERSELIKVEPVVTKLSADLAAWRLAEEVKRREAEMERRRQEEERRRLEEEAIRKAQEAERRAEEEKQMAEQEARWRELAAKNEEEAHQAREEAARKQAEADGRAREEQDRILAQAAAEETKLEPMTIVPQAQKTEGLSFRDNWTYEIISEALIPREYCIPDWVRIGRLAKVEKANLENVVPGVRGVNKPSMVARPMASRS